MLWKYTCLAPIRQGGGYQLALAAQLLAWHNVIYIKIPSAFDVSVLKDARPLYDFITKIISYF